MSKPNRYSPKNNVLVVRPEGIDRQTYDAKVLAFVKEHAELGATGVHHIWLRHDGWCGIHKGGNCTCDPDIEIHREGDEHVSQN
jgi:hypothetical protein